MYRFLPKVKHYECVQKVKWQIHVDHKMFVSEKMSLIENGKGDTNFIGIQMAK